MDDDFEHAVATRLWQMEPDVIAANLASMERWGAYSIVKAAPIGKELTFAHGYFTTLPSISGKTPRHMETILGLRVNQLAAGADVYQLIALPTAGQFGVRGYSTLVDGLVLNPGKTESESYGPGHGAWQITLLVDLAVTRIGRRLGPDEVFEPGPHPKYRAQYGRP